MSAWKDISNYGFVALVLMFVAGAICKEHFALSFIPAGIGAWIVGRMAGKLWRLTA